MFCDPLVLFDKKKNEVFCKEFCTFTGLHHCDLICHKGKGPNCSPHNFIKKPLILVGILVETLLEILVDTAQGGGVVSEFSK